MKNSLIQSTAVGLFALALASCETPISNDTNPASVITSILPMPVQSITKQDLLDNAYNLDQAQAIGLITPGSNVPACAHLINQQLGVEPNPSAPTIQSFTPMVGGVVSAASVAYINALKLAKLKQNGIIVPEACAAAWGEIQLQGLGQLFNIGGGLPITIVPGGPPAAAPTSVP